MFILFLVSTYNPATNLTIVVNGTGVASKQISLAFGEASDFLEYDTAASLKLYTALPITGDTTRESKGLRGFKSILSDADLHVRNHPIYHRY